MDDSVAEAVNLLGAGAHLVGHSQGGLIAMCTAAARPDLVKSLTIVDSPAFAKALADEDLPPDFVPTPAHRRGIVATMTEPAPWRVRVPAQALAAAAYPKLVITGGWHPAFETVGERLAAAIGADWRVLTGRGHGVQSLSEPFNKAVASLWERV